MGGDAGEIEGGDDEPEVEVVEARVTRVSDYMGVGYRELRVYGMC